MTRSPDVIDLSHWNTPTDWTRIRAAGVDAVIHKCTQGTWTDPAFEKRRAPAKAAGLLFGRYHFGIGEDVPGQVTAFLKTWTPDELLALDWEQNVRLDARGNTVPAGPTMSMSEAEEFCDLVLNRTGVRPVLYSGDTLKEAVKARPATTLAQCRLWLAQFGPTPKPPPGWDSYWLWQFTNQAVIPGCIGYVDRSVFDGSPAELAATWAPTSAEETPYQEYKRLATERGIFAKGEDEDVTWKDLNTLMLMIPPSPHQG